MATIRELLNDGLLYEIKALQHVDFEINDNKIKIIPKYNCKQFNNNYVGECESDWVHIHDEDSPIEAINKLLGKYWQSVELDASLNGMLDNELIKNGIDLKKHMHEQLKILGDVNIMLGSSSSANGYRESVVKCLLEISQINYEKSKESKESKESNESKQEQLNESKPVESSESNESKQEQSNESKSKLQYGFAPDGTYITPFLYTIIYSENSLLQCAIAGAFKRAQLIPLGNSASLGSALRAVEYNTPNLYILFDLGRAKYELDIRASIAFAGKQFDTIFVYCAFDPPSEQQIADGINWNSLRANFVNYFSVDALYSIPELNSSFVIFQIIESFLVLEYPNYTSKISSIDTAQNLKYGMNSLDKPIVATVARLASSWKSITEVDDLITRGRILREFTAQIAAKRVCDFGISITVEIAQSPDSKVSPFRSVLCVESQEFAQDMVKALLTHVDELKQSPDYGLLYQFRRKVEKPILSNELVDEEIARKYEDTVTNGYWVRVVSFKYSAVDFFGAFGVDCKDTPNPRDVSIWLDCKKTYEILNFLRV